MLEISINLVIITHVVVSLLLILVILMQRPKQEGLGAAFGSGMTDAAWGARTTDVLQKGTVYLGTLFFLLSLTLGILMGRANSNLAKDFASDGASKVETPAAGGEVAAPTIPEPLLVPDVEPTEPTGDTPEVPAADEPTGDTPDPDADTEAGAPETSDAPAEDEVPPTE